MASTKAASKKSGSKQPAANPQPQCNGAVKGAVVVRIKLNERLTYTLTVKGARPTFTLNDVVANVNLLTDTSQPTATLPDVVYSRVWPRDAHDQINVDTNHTLNMVFLDNTTEYKYKVVHTLADGTSDTLIDCTYKLGPNVHFFPQTLRVFTDK